MGYMFSALIGSVVIFMAIATEINYEMDQRAVQLIHQGESQQSQFVDALNNATISWLKDNAASSCTSGSSCTIQNVCTFLQSQTNSAGQPYYIGPCESPLGEKGWELIYDAQGNYILQATDFDQQQFKRYIPVSNPSYTISPGVTLADKFLADSLVKHPPHKVQYKGVTDVFQNSGAVNSTPGLNSYTDGESFIHYVKSHLGLKHPHFGGGML